MDTATLGLVGVVDEGLGNSCYLLDLGDGRAMVVDLPRDLRAVRAAAARRGWRIDVVADTHLHADFLSGAVQLAHDDGATVLASAWAGREFAHRGLVDGEQVELGGLTVTAWATPGHTDEHLCFLVNDGARTVGVFTGGSLIVGSAARTDLLGADRAHELARAQFGSLRRLAALPPGTAVWPTHGAGSFCSAPPGAERTSTIGRELVSNPLLGAASEDEFVATLLGSLGSYPPYFLRLGEINRRGPVILDTRRGARLAGLPPAAARALIERGAIALDVRPVTAYAAGHVPAAVSIPLRAQFATWLGWLLPADTPLVVVRDPDQDVEEIVWQAAKIGYESLAGELAGGMPAWTAAGLAAASTELVAPDQLAGRRVLDIRQREEFAGGHLPGAHHCELGALTDTQPTHLDSGLSGSDDPVVLMCGHGERAAGAASLLERAGHRDLAVLVGGPDDWARATGEDLDPGS
jgi:glyoxylase-like metal-dependent hydrolase (beta-lactamase superfamily II)/rhodanese-related sulfurtransferase